MALACSVSWCVLLYCFFCSCFLSPVCVFSPVLTCVSSLCAPTSLTGAMVTWSDVAALALTAIPFSTTVDGESSIRCCFDYPSFCPICVLKRYNLPRRAYPAGEHLPLPHVVGDGDACHMWERHLCLSNVLGSQVVSISLHQTSNSPHSGLVLLCFTPVFATSSSYTTIVRSLLSCVIPAPHMMG